MPVAAGDADAADAIAIDEYGIAAGHGGPAFGPGGKAEAEGVQGIQILALGAFGGGRAPVGRRRYRFGCRGMHGVKAAPVHAFEHNHMAASIDNSDGRRNAKFAGLGDGGLEHRTGARIGQAQAGGGRHRANLSAG